MRFVLLFLLIFAVLCLPYTKLQYYYLVLVPVLVIALIIALIIVISNETRLKIIMSLVLVIMSNMV